MNRSMKQMLSALLVVAMVAALLVVPSVAADAKTDGIYKLTVDTAPVTVKEGETKEVAVKAEYAVSADTYAVVADTNVYATAADTKVATAAVKDGKVVITAVKEGKTDVVVTVKGTKLQATIPVEVKAAGPAFVPGGDYSMSADELLAAGQKTFAGDPAGTAGVAVGTNGFFKIHGKSSGSSKIEATKVVASTDPGWEDGFTSVNRINWGGTTMTYEGDKVNISSVIEFTVDRPAEVTVWFINDTSTNVALFVKDAQAPVAVSEAYTLASNALGKATVKATEAGTYFIGASANNAPAKFKGVCRVEVTLGSEQPPVVDPEQPEPTVYEVKADTKVTVTAGSKKNVNVTVTPAGEIYAVSADTKTATVTYTGNTVTITGVKAGKTTVTVGVKDGVGSAEIAVTVNAKGNGGGSSSGRPSNRPGTPAANLPFTDVKAEDWFYTSVQKAFAKGLMKGTSDTTFAPDAKTTRAMVATVLYRLAGENKVDVEKLFNDVAADTWYTDAVAWAAEKGIVKGYDETTFAPNDNVTREQLVVMLYRYAGVTAKSEKDLSDFTDTAAISDWAVEAMTWAVEKGIILGRGNGQLDPKGLASRAEVCTVLVRYLEMK